MDRMQIEQIQGVQSAEYPKQNENLIYKDIFIGGKKETKQLSLIGQTTKVLILGRGLTKFDNEIKNNVAVIDSVTATQLYETEEKALDKGIEIEGYIFKIIGIYQGSEIENILSLPETNIELPPNVYTRYFTTQGSSMALMVTLEENTIPATVTTEVINLLEEKGSMKEFGEYIVFDTALLSDGISQILSTITLFISCVAGISLVIAGVGVCFRTHERDWYSTSIRCNSAIDSFTIFIRGSYFNFSWGLDWICSRYWFCLFNWFIY
jgi:putative ABC transport system permease protein